MAFCVFSKKFNIFLIRWQGLLNTFFPLQQHFSVLCKHTEHSFFLTTEHTGRNTNCNPCKLHHSVNQEQITWQVKLQGCVSAVTPQTLHSPAGKYFSWLFARRRCRKDLRRPISGHTISRALSLRSRNCSLTKEPMACERTD